MSDSEAGNLIDLSLSFEEATNPSAITAQLSCMSKCLISSPELERRESLDNNPFDCIQKLAQRPADPFDMHFYKAHQECPRPVEVKTGNLLSLSDDNILDDDVEDSPTTDIPKFASDATLDSVGSTIHQTTNELDTESPPLAVSSRWTPDSGGPDSGGGGSSDSSAAGLSAKTKKALEHRKRLLKLSISNSTFNSPVSRRMPVRRDGTGEVFEDDYIFQQSPCAEEPMIAAESPLKMIDDDLMSEQPPPAFADADKDFDADLEMLKIPMLQELPSPAYDAAKLPVIDKLPSEEKRADVSVSSRSQNTSTVGALPNLDALRAKLRSRREESHATNSHNNNTQDIPVLIENLKSLICDIDAVDEHKKRQASSLLESLSSALVTKEETAAEGMQVPQPIKRQGTFDIDLQGQNGQDTEMGGGGGGVHLEPGNINDVPDSMFKSSATYDGEPVEERDLMLPRIDCISPDTSQHPNAPPQGVVGADVNDIIEQLSKLLEQHQLNQQQQMHSDSSDGSTSGQTPMNPTFIVVMNSSQMPTQNQVASLQSAMERSFQNSSLADMDGGSNASMRRRSQSLSIHDKVKFVQLPMAAPMEDEHVSNTPPATQMDCNDFKTPSRPMTRRNSFSSGTPYTPMMDGGASASAAAAAARRAFVMNSANTRRASLLDAGRDYRQQQAIVKPIPLPHNNMNTFKPDLKKKLKSGSSSESSSIMKSTGPLKATIPVKKVAPMLKHSPPTPEEVPTGGMGSSTKACLNSSMHLLTKAGKMSYTSTPMPLSRSAGSTLGVPSGYPNACSTPTVNASPVRSLTRPRYSYGGPASASKIHSTATPSAAASNIKRRNLSELKVKSPMKTRLSGIGMGGGGAAASTMSKASAAAAKVAATRMSTTTSRTGPGNKTQQSNTLTTRIATTSRLSTRSSFSSSATVNKNKENRHP